MVLLASGEDKKVPGSVLLVVERWVGGSGWRIAIVGVARTSLMPQLRHDPRPDIVGVRTETFGA